MARVSGPMMSIDASGKFANTMVFSIWKGRNYVRKHFIPANNPTTAQLGFRATFGDAILAWKTIPATDGSINSNTLQTSKEGWVEAARDCSPSISGANYFVSQWCLQAQESGFVEDDGPTIPAIAPQHSDSIHGR